MSTHHAQIMGTIAGAALPAFTINTEDIKATIVLAIIGAISGFLTTVVLRHLVKYVTNLRDKSKE